MLIAAANEPCSFPFRQVLISSENTVAADAQRLFPLLSPLCPLPRPLWALTSRVLLLVAIATPFPKPSVLSSGRFHNGTGSIALHNGFQAVREGDSASHSSCFFFLNLPFSFYFYGGGWCLFRTYLFSFLFLFYSIPFFSSPLDS